MIKENINGKFEMKYFGVSKRILRMNIMINHEFGGLILFQHRYLKRVVKWFVMSDVNIIRIFLDHTQIFSL